VLRPALALVALVPLALVVTACAGERPEQQAARAVVARHVVGLEGYDADDIRCTGNPRPWFVEQSTSVYICAVARDDGDCDWFRVTVRDGNPEVTLDTRRAGCVLPA
jgi:hypothetical protein